MGARQRPALAFVVALILVALFATPATANGAPTLTVADTTTLIEDGDAVLARVAVSCPEGTEVLEAHLRISQDEQTVSGEAPIFGIICDGRTRTRVVRVSPLEGQFHAGEAFASAFLLVIDPDTGQTQQAQDAKTVLVRGRP